MWSESTDFRQTSFGSTNMTLLGFARVLRIAPSIDSPTDDMSTVLKKSREGLYFTQEGQANLLQLWEELRHQSVITEGPEIQSIRYEFAQILGVIFDGSNMTKETCSLAVVDDQLSPVTDVMLDKGIEAVMEIAGAIQCKEKYVRRWVVAYDMRRNKFNRKGPMRAILGDPYKNAWDTWPDNVWKHDDDSVELVHAYIQEEKKQRTQGIFNCVWSNVRSMIKGPRTDASSMEVKEEEVEPPVESVKRPTFFTGELREFACGTLKFHQTGPETYH